MANTFPLVRKGYDPEAVDTFVREQAEAWRAELDKAAAAVDEWSRRAGELGVTVAALERQVADVERRRGEQISALETTVAELRWSRDQARGELEEMLRELRGTHGDARAIIEAAQGEVAKLFATAEAEIEAMYASARRRIAMAEDHARDRIERSEATVEISVRS